MTFFEALKSMTIEEISSFLAKLMGSLLVETGVISENVYDNSLAETKEFIIECLEREVPEDDKT